MAKSLVIVESPAKAKTIEKFLGPGYRVLASYGHVRALPSKQGSVDIAHDFNPLYAVLPESLKHIELLKREVATASEILLATDPDREGEAIAWHLLQALGVDAEGKKPLVKRVTFHEITKGAIQQAVAQAGKIDQNLVDAQQARSILDYLVGFNLSPLLWKKIRYGLSAGRVQSVALRLICEREQDIAAFNEREYWTIEVLFAGSKAEPFKAQLVSVDGKKLDKFAITSEAEASDLVRTIERRRFRVGQISKAEKKRNPAPPFTTSTLQQEASRKLGFGARKTMSVAQKLYEGVDIGDGAIGLITYMRTDSVVLSETATTEARELIIARYGKEYSLAKPRVFKNKAKNAQEAHEAVRPTSLANTPERVKSYLSPEQYRLYQLIWTRTMASQMASAILDATTVEVESLPPAEDPVAAADQGARTLGLRASGQVVRFPGFMKLYIEGTDDAEEEQEGLLPTLDVGEALQRKETFPLQHFTQPPPRYTEASLVKILEEYGIGRPSTYASIMNTLVMRKYARLEKRTFFPEDIGMVVSDLLVKHFSQYVDYDFTAQMEEILDEVSRGEKLWKPVLREFWEPFIALIKVKDKEIVKEDLTTEKTEKICPDCGKPLVVKLGRAGKFIACSGFPECRHTAPLSVDGKEPEAPMISEEVCEKCGEKMLIKEGRFGKYLACSGYPKCKNIQPLIKPVGTGIICPICHQGELTEKKSRYGKIFYSCNRYPDCKFAAWDPPVNETCPKCAFPILVEKVTKRDGTYRKCAKEGCDYRKVIIPPPEKAAPAAKAARKAPA
ncbi:MAG: type I DNA topoisomerase, partial [Desulfuromonadales bacterium]|nr:type I DNA topoisomerase [Desulfuromonadales bacterium]